MNSFRGVDHQAVVGESRLIGERNHTVLKYLSIAHDYLHVFWANRTALRVSTEGVLPGIAQNEGKRRQQILSSDSSDSEGCEKLKSSRKGAPRRNLDGLAQISNLKRQLLTKALG